LAVVALRNVNHTFTQERTAMKQEMFVTLAALEHDWGHAWMNRDSRICADLIADDFLEIGANGRFVSKSEWLGAIARPPRQVHWLDLRVRPLARCAIVHGRLHLLAGSNGHDHRDSLIATDVWSLRDDRWQVVSRQLTPEHAHAHPFPRPQLAVIGTSH
jgi:hypothetical protein